MSNNKVTEYSFSIIQKEVVLDNLFIYNILLDIARLEKDTLYNPWSVRELSEALSGNNFYIFIISNNTYILAYCLLYYFEGEAEIINIATKANYRCKGLAFQLLNKIFVFFSTQISENVKLNRVLLEVRSSNIAALVLYKKIGFARIGMRKKYYIDTGEDAYVYEYLLK